MTKQSKEYEDVENYMWPRKEITIEELKDIIKNNE